MSSACKIAGWALVYLMMAGPSRAADYTLSIISEGLEHPWSIAFLPNDEMLVTERTGRLRMIRQDELLNYDVTDLPKIFVHKMPNVFIGNQEGLFDIVVDRNFVSNSKIYLSYSAGTDSSNSLQVISATLGGSRLENIQTILTMSEKKATRHHFGGRMAMLADGTLLITSGEGFDYRGKAQSLTSLFGKVLRINTDGSAPTDNPFYGRGDARPEIFSFGHRNPQGLVIAENGNIWQHEHGPKGGDELNLLVAGGNYGWPAVTYGRDYLGAVISPFSEAEGMESPTVYWSPSIAPAGMTEYRGDAFPDWRGNLFVAALKEQSVRRLVLDGNVVVDQEIMFTEINERIRDIRTGPDGYLYILTDSKSGKVIRVTPGR